MKKTLRGKRYIRSRAVVGVVRVERRNAKFWRSADCFSKALVNAVIGFMKFSDALTDHIVAFLKEREDAINNMYKIEDNEQ